MWKMCRNEKSPSRERQLLVDVERRPPDRRQRDRDEQGGGGNRRRRKEQSARLLRVRSCERLHLGRLRRRAVRVLVLDVRLVVDALDVDRPDVVVGAARAGCRPRASPSASSGRSCCSGAGRCGRPAGGSRSRRATRGSSAPAPRSRRRRSGTPSERARRNPRSTFERRREPELLELARGQRRRDRRRSSSTGRRPRSRSTPARRTPWSGRGPSRAPRAEVLDAADPDARLVDVDPVVGEQVLAVDDERDGEEVAVAQSAAPRRRTAPARAGLAIRDDRRAAAATR